MEALKKREEKMWEKSRQKRVNGWRNWVNGDGDKGPKRPKLKEVHPLHPLHPFRRSSRRCIRYGAVTEAQGGAFRQRRHGLSHRPFLTPRRVVTVKWSHRGPRLVRLEPSTSLIRQPPDHCVLAGATTRRQRVQLVLGREGRRLQEGVALAP